MTNSYSDTFDTYVLDGVLTANGTRMTVGVATRKGNGSKFVSLHIKAADGRSLSARLGRTPARFILNAMVEAVEEIEASPVPPMTSSPSPPEPNITER